VGLTTTALKQTLFNGPIPGGNGKRLYVGSYLRKAEAEKSDAVQLEMKTIYDRDEFFQAFCDFAQQEIQIGQEKRMDALRLKFDLQAGDLHWWGMPLSSALRSRGIISTGKYVKSKVPACKGGRTPILVRIA
jgi:hypothetical protein